MPLYIRADITVFEYRGVVAYLRLAGEDISLHYEWDGGLFAYDHLWLNGWLLLFNHLYVGAGDPETTLIDTATPPQAFCADWATEAGQWLRFQLQDQHIYVVRFNPFTAGGNQGVEQGTWLPLRYLWDCLPKSKEIKDYVAAFPAH